MIRAGQSCSKSALDARKFQGLGSSGMEIKSGLEEGFSKVRYGLMPWMVPREDKTVEKPRSDPLIRPYRPRSLPSRSVDPPGPMFARGPKRQPSVRHPQIWGDGRLERSSFRSR